MSVGSHALPFALTLCDPRHSPSCAPTRYDGWRGSLYCPTSGQYVGLQDEDFESNGAGGRKMSQVMTTMVLQSLGVRDCTDGSPFACAELCA